MNEQKTGGRRRTVLTRGSPIEILDLTNCFWVFAQGFHGGLLDRALAVFFHRIVTSSSLFTAASRLDASVSRRFFASLSIEM